MADFALPQSLDISVVKRNSMPAVRRTVLHGSTSQNTYGAGELVYIPVDTGTSGSFFDPSTSRLDMTVHVYNKNYFVDFFSLPRCGFHSIIEEFGIEIHNSLHENQRFYAEMIESEMMRNGENATPYELTVSNPYEVGGGNAGEMHINLIKPSMVTTAGLPHGVQYGVLTQPTGSNMSSSIANVLTEGLLLNAHPYLKKMTGRRGYGNVPAGEDIAILESGVALNNHFRGWATSNLPAPSTYDDRQYRNGLFAYGYDTTKTAPLNSSQTLKVFNNPTTDDVPWRRAVLSGSSYGQHLALPHRFCSSAAASASTYSKIIPMTSSDIGHFYSDNSIFDVDYGQTVGGYTPMMWPAKQPCDLEKLFAKLKYARKGVNTKNVQNYYANCKNISCAIPVLLTDDTVGASTIWGDLEHTLPTMSDPVRGQKTSFRVSLKIYSSLIGVYARKFFPSLLIGAGRVRLRMRLQQANVAFQTLMDPCRVVPRTARDKYPYQGCFQTGTYSTQTGLLQTETIQGLLTNCPIMNVAHSVHPILITNYIPGACFNDMVATGRFPVPQMRMKAMNAPYGVSVLQNSNALLNQQMPYAVYTGAETVGTSTKNVTKYGEVKGAYSLNAGIAGVAPAIHRNTINLVNIQPHNETPQGFHPWDPSFQNHVIHAACYDYAVGANDAATNANIQAVRGVDINMTMATHLSHIYKVIQTLTHEFSRNVHYGYPSHFIHETGQTAAMITENGCPDLTELLHLSDSSCEINGYTKVGAFQNYTFSTDSSSLCFPGDARLACEAGDLNSSCFISPSFQTTATISSDAKYNGLNWDPFCYPQPQYVPFLRPWDKRATRTFGNLDFCAEEHVCYGTYLPHSVAQVRRTNKNLFPLDMDGEHSPGITESLTYTVTNIVYRVEEIILPESASLQIIASAMEGGITIESSTVKVIEQILQKQDNQKILLNVSAGIVDDICFLFQPTELYQGQKAYGYNSFAFYCPWTSFQFKLQSTGTVYPPNAGISSAPPQSPDSYNYLGGEPSYYNALVQSENIAINTFLSIATEYFPRNPINDIQTLLDHVTWGDQRRGDVEYLGLEPMVHNTYDSANFTTILPFQDGFFSVFTPIETLNDQTITCNPFFTPLEMSVQKVLRGARAKQPALPFFKPLEGTFHLSFNLQAFMGQQDRMNVGTPMVNNNSYLQMQQCHLLREVETRMLTLIRCFARIVIERGGIVQIFT